VVDETGLTDSNYTILSNLTDGAYYWRARPIDGAINQGGWSSVWPLIVLADINPTTAVSNTVSDEIPPDISAVVQADTEVFFGETGNVSGTIVVAKCETEPTTPAIAFSTGTGKEPVKFIDVLVSGFTTGTATVKVHYTDEEVAGLAEESLGLYYWAGENWKTATNNSVDTANNIVSGDIPVSALAGTPVGVGGVGTGASTSFNWAPVIGGIIGGIAIISAVFYLLMRRRRRPV
jgi:hypothetical protein